MLKTNAPHGIRHVGTAPLNGRNAHRPRFAYRTRGRRIRDMVTFPTSTQIAIAVFVGLIIGAGLYGLGQIGEAINAIVTLRGAI